MKLATPLAVLFTLFSTTAAADEFSDFRIPEHSAHLLSGNLSGSMRREEDDRPWESGTREDYYGDVSARWRSVHESDPASLSWGASWSSFGGRSAGHSHEVGVFGASHSTTARARSKDWIKTSRSTSPGEGIRGGCPSESNSPHGGWPGSTTGGSEGRSRAHSWTR